MDDITTIKARGNEKMSNETTSKKTQKSIRIYDDYAEILIKKYGTIQRAIDHMVDNEVFNIYITDIKSDIAEELYQKIFNKEDGQ